MRNPYCRNRRRNHFGGPQRPLDCATMRARLTRSLSHSLSAKEPVMATASATASRKKMFIDSQWVEAEGGRSLGVINPATEEVICEIAYGGRKDARRALEAAARAMPAWMKLTAWDRAKVLKKTADLMRERLESIARTLTTEQGKPLPESRAEI